jgi:hypothetical protein
MQSWFQASENKRIESWSSGAGRSDHHGFGHQQKNRTKRREKEKNNRDRQLDLTGQVSDPNFHISKSPFGWIKAQSKELLFQKQLLFRSIFFKAP